MFLPSFFARDYFAKLFVCLTGLATDGCDVILPTWASGRWILGNFFTNPDPAVFLNADSDPDADPDKLQRDF